MFGRIKKHFEEVSVVGRFIRITVFIVASVLSLSALNSGGANAEEVCFCIGPRSNGYNITGTRLNGTCARSQTGPVCVNKEGPPGPQGPPGEVDQTIIDDLQAQIDALASKACGDNEIDAIFGEECDGENLGGLECTDFEFLSGELMCSEDCLSFDTSGCSNAPPGPVCGNSMIDGAEVCDGEDLGGRTCIDEGFIGGGDLMCSGDCLSFDTSGCRE